MCVGNSLSGTKVYKMKQRILSLSWTLGLFFLSGATSLVYEVLWTRRLSLTFGHTVLAVSTVLTVFMSGLALGSFLAGRWTDRERQRLRSENKVGPSRFLSLYGKIEIGIGAWAVLTLVLFNGLEWVYLSAARQGAGSGLLYSIVFLGSFLVLLPPTAAMGATLPIFTQLLVATREDLGMWLSRIYGWNTVGACVGAGVGGFILLPWLGLKTAVMVSALGNLVIGVVAIRYAEKLKIDVEPEAVESEIVEQESANSSGGWLLPVAFGLSGFAAMIYQLGWTRGLILSIGSSTYSFAIILTAFLASLGLGSLIYKKIMASRTASLAHLAYLQFAIGLSSLLTTILIGELPQLMVTVIPALNFSFLKILLFDFVLCVGLMLLPTLAMGLTFPLVTQLYTDRLSSLGRRLGEVYAANTCGAIAGSFLGGFVLIPGIGAQRALIGAVVLNLVVGIVLAVAGKVRRPLVAAIAVLSVGAVVMSPAWDPVELSAGAGIYAKAENFLFKPAFYKDGLSATVTVGYNGPHSPYLKVNGKTDASLGAQDMAHQVLLGLLPVALHPNPKNVAVVGLGSGVSTAVLAAADSVEKIHCSELEPAIVEVQNYFAPYNEHVLDNPKLEVHVTDGRTFVMGSPDRFDLIVSQPSNPWIAGIGNLYTEDFYRACQERLEPGGVMCQWFHLYSISEYDLELVLSTFFSVFPEGLIFQTGPGDILLLGSEHELTVDRERLEELWVDEDLARWLQSIGMVEPNYLLGSFVATRDQVIASGVASMTTLNTDDRPLLEFQAPLSLYLTSGQVGFTATYPDLVPQGFQDDPEAKGAALLGRLQLGRLVGLSEVVDKALRDQIPWAPLAGAIMAEDRGDMESAEGLLRALDPKHATESSAQLIMGNMWHKAKQWEQAIIHYESALLDPPHSARYIILTNLGDCYLQLQRYDEAFEAIQASIDIYPRPEGYYELGHVTYLRDRDPEQSITYFEKALSLDPGDYSSLYRMAILEAELGRFEQAIEHSEKSYHLFRENIPNVKLLADLYAHAGNEKRARELYQENRELTIIAGHRR